MKTKSRINQVITSPDELWFTHTENGSHPDEVLREFSAGHYGDSRSTETIAYTTRPPGSGSSNVCEHTRVTKTRHVGVITGWENDPLFGWTLHTWANPSASIVDATGGCVGSSAQFGVDLPGLIDAQYGDWPLFSENQFADMVPGIKRSWSVLNTLYEFKDFRGLPDRIRHMGSLFVNLTQHNYGLLKSVSGSSTSQKALRNLRVLNPTSSLRAVINTASLLAGELLLEHSFEVRPLLSDINNIFKQVQGARSMARRLLDEENRVLVYHRSASSPLQGYTTDVVVGDTVVEKRSHSILQSEVNSTLKFSYALPAYVRDNVYTLANLERAGLTFRPSILWDAVPWTFAIDWLFDIGRLLDDLFEVKLINPAMVIHDACTSLKTVESVDRYISLYPTSGRSSGEFTLIANDTTTTYFRKPVVPTFVRSGNYVSSLSGFEIVLAAALARTRRRKSSRAL